MALTIRCVETSSWSAGWARVKFAAVWPKHGGRSVGRPSAGFVLRWSDEDNLSDTVIKNNSELSQQFTNVISSCPQRSVLRTDVRDGPSIIVRMEDCHAPCAYSGKDDQRAKSGD